MGVSAKPAGRKMATRRAIAAVAIAAFVCVATFAVMSYADNALPDEGIIAESVGAPHLDVLKNIIRLKAYCLAAWDDARLLSDQFKGKYSAITDFVLSYGQEGGGVSRGGRKAHIDNIVMEYAAVMGTLRVKYPRGINKYILDNIDHAVKHDLNGVVFEKNNMNAFGDGGKKGRKYGHLVALRKKAIGLTERPRVVTQLAAKSADFLHFKTIAGAQAANADAIAATMFLKSKGAGRYHSFLQREIAKVQRKMRHDFDVVAKSAFGAEEDAFEESVSKDENAFFAHVSVQAPAGVSAAVQTAGKLPWRPPTMAAMKKIAAKHSAKFLAEFKKKIKGNPAKLIKTMVDQAGGVKLFFATAETTNAQSTMKPTIKFIGKEHSMEGEIRTVPGRGSVFVQHFGTSRPIGKIQKVELTGTGKGLKWNCASIKVRVGGQDASVYPLITQEESKSFWLKSGETVELKVDPKAATKGIYTKQGCMGWRATEECDGHGKESPSNNKGCTDQIDSSMSGFCKCDTGALKRLDCGHATFTCDEMCKE